MLSFKMNMPFYLMVFYGSILIAAVLVLRGLLRDKLPKFVFPILWSAVLLRLLVPFSLSSPLRSIFTIITKSSNMILVFRQV